jgi:CO/xanthine dehydrogenase Mo-binding subunit
MSGHEVSRRTFVQVSGGAGAGLMLGFSLLGCRKSAVATGVLDPGALNAWIRIGTDESVTFVISESEMGQGIHTALAMLLAEELEVDWSRVRTEHAQADRTQYGRQSTGGSTSIRSNHERLACRMAAWPTTRLNCRHRTSRPSRTRRASGWWASGRRGSILLRRSTVQPCSGST